MKTNIIKNASLVSRLRKKETVDKTENLCKYFNQGIFELKEDKISNIVLPKSTLKIRITTIEFISGFSNLKSFTLFIDNHNFVEIEKISMVEFKSNEIPSQIIINKNFDFNNQLILLRMYAPKPFECVLNYQYVD